MNPSWGKPPRGYANTTQGEQIHAPRGEVSGRSAVNPSWGKPPRGYANTTQGEQIHTPRQEARGRRQDEQIHATVARDSRQEAGGQQQAGGSRRKQEERRIAAALSLQKQVPQPQEGWEKTPFDISSRTFPDTLNPNSPKTIQKG